MLVEGDFGLLLFVRSVVCVVMDFVLDASAPVVGAHDETLEPSRRLGLSGNSEFILLGGLLIHSSKISTVNFNRTSAKKEHQK